MTPKKMKTPAEAGIPASPAPAMEAEPVVADRLLKDALFASIDPAHKSPLYCGVSVTPMTQACAAVFYVPRDWSREQVRAWLDNPQGFTQPVAQEPVAEVTYLSPKHGMIVDGKAMRIPSVNWLNTDDLKIGSLIYAHPATPAPVEVGLREAINALKPFSEACEQVDTKGNPDTAGFIGAGLTLGDLRAARRTLAALRARHVGEADN